MSISHAPMMSAVRIRPAALNHENIIYLTGQPEDVFPPVPSFTEGVVFMMSTYEEFMIILATASLIVSILHYTHKK